MSSLFRLLRRQLNNHCLQRLEMGIPLLGNVRRRSLRKQGPSEAFVLLPVLRHYGEASACPKKDEIMQVSRILLHVDERRSIPNTTLDRESDIDFDSVNMHATASMKCALKRCAFPCRNKLVQCILVEASLYKLITFAYLTRRSST